MSQSLARLLVHLIYSTKNRYPFIREEISHELHTYMATVLKSLASPAIEIGSFDDHVHAVFQLSKIQTLVQVIKKLKTDTSEWIKSRGGIYLKFYWQAGYGAFSVSPGDLDQVRRYISLQREHHKTIPFQEEFIDFLKKHHLPYDERYIWD